MNIKQIGVGTATVAGLFFLLNACGSAPVTPPAATACGTKIAAGTAAANVYVPADCQITLGGSSKTLTIEGSAVHPLDSVSSNWPSAIAAAQTDQAVTFTAAGVYTFKCHVHGGFGMTGKITVVN